MIAPRLAAVFALASLLLVASGPAHSQTRPILQLVAVLDGPSESSTALTRVFVNEITEFFKDEYDVRFADPVAGDWTAAGVHSAADRALAVPNATAVLALGPLCSQDLARRRNLPVPVIACIVLDAKMQGLPRKDGASGVPNLTYLDEQYSIPNLIGKFESIAPFRKLAVVISRGLLESIPSLPERAREASRALNAVVDYALLGDSAEQTLASLPPDADAVYLAPLLSLSPGEFDALVRGINARRLPSFSYMGRAEVERGVLASYAARDDLVRRARRAASDLHRILDGEDAGSLPVEFTRTAQLTINMATAREIGFSPSWPILTEAELINAEESAGPELTLIDCVREAMRVNPGLLAARRQEEAGRQDVTIARAALLPQVSASAQETVTRKETAEASFGSQPERLLDGTIGFRQVIYSERAWSQYAIEKHLRAGREADLHGEELDIALDAAEAYINVLRAAAIARIQRANLRVSLSNLDLARVRQSIGVSGPSDVYRWESQVATNRRSVLEADANEQVARVQVNRVLNRPLEAPFTTRDTAVDDPNLLTGQPALFGYLANPRTFSVFRDFMVTEGWNRSPELRQVDYAIAAQERAHAAARRSYVVPDLFLQGGLSYTFDRSGAGAEGLVLPPPIPAQAFPKLPDYSWQVEFGLTLPLFTGLEREATVRQTGLEVDRLKFQRDDLATGIAEGVRATLHVSGASYAGIEQAQAASRASRQNLDLITESYASGSTSIITLIDAQNEALISEQAASNAVYDFLSDLMRVERAVGWFYFLGSPEEQQALFERLDAYYRAQGVTPAR